MTSALSGTAYEQRLQLEIERINQKVKDLVDERLALERQLILARQESSGLSDVSRKNSVNRVMIERRLISALRSKEIMTNKELLAQAQLVAFDLNPNTFRTQLHRLKAKGLIETASTPGNWRLVKKSQDVFT